MLVYEGSFESLDGLVVITRAHLDAFAMNHNRKIAQFLDGQVPPAAVPPVQADHSTSAMMTVGRLFGPLHVDEVEIGGIPTPALIGTVTFLGADNIERARDGRFTHVSIGADLEAGVINELSVTPFPAAPRAALLSRLGAGMNLEKMRSHLMATKKCTAEEADGYLAAMNDEEKAALWKEVEATSTADEDDHDGVNATDGDGDADDHLGDGDGDEDDKKHLGDDEKKPHAEPDGDEGRHELKGRPKAKKKLSAKLSKLLEKGRRLTAAAKLEARRADITAKLSKLRADAKVSPAEIKRLGELKLEEAGQDALDLVFRVLGAREAVVPVGQVGTVRAVDLSAAGSEQKREEIRADAMKNMRFTARAIEATRKAEAKRLGRRMSDESTTTEQPPKKETVEASMADEHLAHYLDMIEECMAAGDMDHAMGHMKALRKHLAGEHDGSEAPPNAAMSALTKRVTELTAYVAELEQAVGEAA